MVVKIRLLHKPVTHSVLYSQSKCSHDHFTCIKEDKTLFSFKIFCLHERHSPDGQFKSSV